MTQVWRKGDRIRILVPTVGGWQGEAILTEDEMPECEDDLVYWRRAEDDDAEREDGCCIKAEAEWICSRFEAHLSVDVREIIHAYQDASWTQPGRYRHKDGLAAVLRVAASRAKHQEDKRILKDLAEQLESTAELKA